MTKILFTALSASLSLFLTACGGSGDSVAKVTPPSPASLNITIDSNISSMEERTSGQIKLSYANVDGDVALSVNSIVSDLAIDQYSVTADNANKEITIVMGDVYMDGDLSFTVTGTDNSKTDSVNVSMSIINSSVVATIQKLSLLTSSLEDISGATESRKVLTRLTELSVLLGQTSSADANAQIDSVDALLDQTALVALKEKLVDKNYEILYASGMSELDIDEVMTEIKTNLPLYSANVYALIVSTQEALGHDFIPAFLNNNFYIDTDYQSVSRFWMNPEMGGVTDDKYSFNDEYDYLTAVLFPESQTCNQ